MQCPPTGNRLAQLRNEAGLSQIELAQRLGVDTTTVWRWETGQAEGGLYKRANELALMFGATVAEVMGWPEADGNGKEAA